MTPVAALSEPERLVRDALTVAYNAGAEHEVRIYEIDDRARDLVAALRPLLAAEPEIVTRNEARDLPPDSRLAPCTAQGVPLKGGPIVTPDDPVFREQWSARKSYVVLHRAPAPAPKVGDVVRSEAELDRLPGRSVLRSQVGAKNILERSVDGSWHNSSGDHIGLGIITSAWLPARVLDLGGDS